MTLVEQIHDVGRRARVASRKLAKLSSIRKNAILQAMAEGLEDAAKIVLEANAKDVAAAEAAQLSGASVDRLRLDEKRIFEMARGIREVAVLPDPVGEVLSDSARPNGIEIRKVRVPIGVIGIIYESRPNVTSDAAVLCLKTGNATILRGGSEAFHSNTAIVTALQKSGAKAGLPPDSIQLIPTTDREAVSIMAKLDQFIDLIIPRGGHALIERVVNDARMPVIKHFHGVCHLYVDADSDVEMALRIAENGKCQRPGVCNSLETVLVHESIAAEFLPKLATALAKVELRADEAALALLGDRASAATEESWTTEYLDYILSVKVVASLDAAIEHINHYGSHHSDVIVTRNEPTAQRFLNEVDSATVYWNASTRFTDGGEFGFGAEIGISTDKLHARGPMGLPELTSYKYVIRGTGQIRE